MRARRRRRWVIAAVVVALVAFGAMLMLARRSSNDLKAEYRRIVLAAQDVTPTSTNGWPELIAIGEDIDAMYSAIRQREEAADDAAKANGDTPEPWEYGLDANFKCRDSLTPRDIRLREEFLAAIAATDIDGRIASLRSADVFLMHTGDDIVPNATFKIAPVRRLALYLSAAMLHAAQRGDMGGASDRLRDLELVCDAVRGQPGGLSYMVRVAIEDLLFRPVVFALHDGPPGIDALVRTSAEVLRNRENRGSDFEWECMRIEILDHMNAIAEEKSKTFLGFVEVMVPGYGFDISASMRKIEKSHAKWMDSRAKSLPEVHALQDAARSLPTRWSTDWSSDNDWESAFGMSVRIEKQAQFYVMGYKALFAIVLYDADHGHPPESLDALVPDYLDVVPVDSFAPDGRLRYVPGLTLRDVKLYSVGFDGADDGGVNAPDGPYESLHPQSSGCDFVFWPVECR